jgi:ABC-type nitrate/sulfonate/bicarbonate transport system permease component
MAAGNGIFLTGRLRRRGRARERSGHLLARVAAPALFAALVIGAWQAYTAVSGVGSDTLPSPADVASALADNFSLLISNAWTTIEEVLIGYAAAVAVALPIAALIRSSRLVERAVYPWLVISQTIPIPAIAPIIVIWTGFDIRPKVIVIVLVCFFPIVVNTVDGLRAGEHEVVELLRTLGASRWQRFRLGQLPPALPLMFSGLKVAAALSVIGAVFAEWVGSSSGLGYLILQADAQVETPVVFAAVVLLSVLGIALFALVATVERLALPWYRATREALERGQ